MAEIIEVLPDFDGMACKYDPSKNPLFRAIVVENLREIAKCSLGRNLLYKIAQAAPKSRADFMPGVNVLVQPKPTTYTQSGMKLSYIKGTETPNGLVKSDDSKHRPEGCPFYTAGGSCNAAVVPGSSDNGQGTVCYMNFTNVQVSTSKGEKVYPYIVLAHELIHSYHCLYGIKKKGKDEELWTTGIGVFRDEVMSENTLRKLLAPELGTRSQYY